MCTFSEGGRRPACPQRRRKGRIDCCTTEPLIFLCPPAISAKSAAKPTWPTGWNAMATVSVETRRPDVMLHNFKQFSNHLIASQLQQRFATSSRPRSRPTDAWCRCAHYRLFSQLPLKRAAWKCRQQLTFLAPDWSQRTSNGSTAFLLLSNQKQTVFFLQSCKDVWQNPLTCDTL